MSLMDGMKDSDYKNIYIFLQLWGDLTDCVTHQSDDALSYRMERAIDLICADNAC